MLIVERKCHICAMSRLRRLSHSEFLFLGLVQKSAESSAANEFAPKQAYGLWSLSSRALPTKGHPYIMSLSEGEGGLGKDGDIREVA